MLHFSSALLGSPVSTKMLPEYWPVLPTVSKVVCSTTVNNLAEGEEDALPPFTSALAKNSRRDDQSNRT